MLYPPCPWCDEPCLPWDALLFTDYGERPWHAECLMRNIVGSVAHQEKRCACYGGTEVDPPGMTRREAAQAAARLAARG